MADPLPPGRLQLPQGWYVQLSGEKFDLEDWEYTLNEPFDPVVMQEPDGTFLLKSREFDEARTADEVREKALGLINRLNGALALMHGTRPVTLAGVIGVDDQGRRHISVTMTGVGLAIGRARMRATATVLGPDGLARASTLQRQVNPRVSNFPHTARKALWGTSIGRESRRSTCQRPGGRLLYRRSVLKGCPVQCLDWRLHDRDA